MDRVHGDINEQERKMYKVGARDATREMSFWNIINASHKSQKKK